MKSFKLLSLMFLSMFLWSTTQAQLAAKVYEDPKCGAMVKKHESIAILPLDVTITDIKSVKKNRTPQEELDKMALDYQKNFQASMYSWFLKRKQRNKMVPVDIQDVDRTNAILRKNNILTNDDLMAYTMDEIATMLGVDGLFGGKVNKSSSFSKGGATALAVLGGIRVKTGDADVFIKLWDGEEGKMIWSFDRTVSSDYSNTTDDVVEYLMKRITKRFPYER